VPIEPSLCLTSLSRRLTNADNFRRFSLNLTHQPHLTHPPHPTYLTHQDLEGRHFRANLLLGRILTLRGDALLAVPYLRTAVSVQPDSSEAKQFLADALTRSR
jgi:hypothetical protein